MIELFHGSPKNMISILILLVLLILFIHKGLRYSAYTRNLAIFALGFLFVVIVGYTILVYIKRTWFPIQIHPPPEIFGIFPGLVRSLNPSDKILKY